MLSIFAITTFQAIILQASPAANAAATPATPTLVKRYEALRALLGGHASAGGPSCFTDAASTTSGSNELNMAYTITADQYNDADFSPLTNTSTNISVPATLFGDGKNDLSCSRALAYAYETMFDGANLAESRKNFIKAYYDTSTAPYQIKGDSWSKSYSDIRRYMLALVNGKTESYLWWRDRILSQGFNKCWKWGNPATPPTPETRFIADNWVTEDGGNKPVGYMAEVAIEGRYDDGVVNCGDLKTYVMKEDNHYIMGFGEDELHEKLDEATKEAERQAKVDGLNALFTDGNTQKLQDCGVWYGLIPPGENADVGFISDIVSWLSDPQLSPFSNSYNVPITLAIPGGTTTAVTIPAQNPVPAASEVAASAVLTNFKDCLKKAYPTIEDILNITFESPSSERPGDGGGNAEEDKSCESAGGWAWALCPAVEAISGAGNVLTRQISNLLAADRDKYTSPKLYDAWANIRNIALAGLVAMMMVMVIATALNLQAFDAYTVKRALPRMVAAVLFIVLSWYVCIFLIDVFNAAGRGVLGIMTAPFVAPVVAPGEELTLASTFDVGIGTAVANLVGAGALLIGLLLVFIFFGFTIFLFILIAFLVLILRQLFILALMLLAPLAILAWIFPGNDKMWKLWWSSFSKLLMMYPLIMALIGSGRIFAALTQGAGGSAGASGNVLDPIITLAAYTLPFAFIPFTFKTAGGLFANLAGMANDRSKGLFDRAKKRRGEKAQRWAGGQAFKGGGANTFRGRMNKGIEDTINAGKGKGGLRPGMMAANLRTARQDHAESEVEEALKEGSIWNGDDAKVHAARHTNKQQIMDSLREFDRARFGEDGLYGGDSDAQVRRREEAASQIMRSQRKHSHESFQRARVRAQAKTGTGYQDANGEFNAALMMQDINEAYGNDRNGAGKALAEMRGSLTQSGQIAGQAGYGTWAREMENLHNDGNNLDSDVARDAHRAVMQDTIDSVNPGYAVHGKPSSARALASAHRERIQGLIQQMNDGEATITDIVRNPDGTPMVDPATNEVVTALRPPTIEDIQGATAAAAGILDGLTQASPQNASAFANELMVADVSGAGITLPPTTRSVPRYKQDGTVEVDAAGHQVFDVQEVAPASTATNVRELITHFAGQSVRDAPAFHTRRKEYNSLIEAAAAGGGAAAAAAAAGNIPPTPGAPAP